MPSKPAPEIDQQRHVRENMTEEELVVFDILSPLRTVANSSPNDSIVLRNDANLLGNGFIDVRNH